MGARSDAAAIDEALRRVGQPGAESLSALAARVGVNKGSLHRHREHLSVAPADAGSEPCNDSATAEQQPVTKAKTDPSPFAVENPGDDPSTAPRKLISAALEEQAFDLRVQGKTYAYIARKLGVPRHTAADLVERVLVRTVGQTDRKAEHLREVEVRRCDELIESLWGDATEGEDPDVRGRATDRVLRASERKAKLLGLDAPTQQLPFYLAPGFDEFLAALLAPLEERHPEAFAEVVETAREHVMAFANQQHTHKGRPALRAIRGGMAG